MQDINLVWIAVAAFGGGVLSALLGFLDAKNNAEGPVKFDIKKFGKSLIFAAIAAAGFAAAYTAVPHLSARDVLIAILGGAGVDGLTNRAIGMTK